MHAQPCPRQPIKGIAGEIMESARPDVSQRSRFRIAAIFDLTFKSQAAAQSGHSRRTQGDVRRRAESGAVFARFVGMAAKRGKGVGPPFQQVIVEVKADPWRGHEDAIVDLDRKSTRLNSS